MDDAFIQALGPEPGRVEDTYDIGVELGKGAFSIVRHGRHRQTGDNAAIKMIPAFRFRSNARAQEAVRTEVEAMRRIRGHASNTCLISMLGVFADPSKVAIVLEELLGGELFDRIVARGRYTEKDASQLLRKLAMALGDCHDQGILHRDVKPENVLYVSPADDAEVKLTDFGLAMLTDGPSVMRRDENLVGTPGYVAPEVLTSRLYGPPCDVWACGVITYILLAGYPPFFPSGSDSLFDVIKQGKYYFHPDAWDSISSEAKDLVFQMLMVDIHKRATLAAVLEHPWIVQSVELPEEHLAGTIKRLKAFNAKRKWRAVAIVVMMGARLGLKKRHRNASEEERAEQGFSELELDALKNAYESSAERGVLSKAQLASVFADVGFGPLPCGRMFDLFDTNRNGEVDYHEFLAGMSAFRHSGDEALRFCFDIYDRDGKGTINLEELKSVLTCVTHTEDLSDAEASDDDDKLNEIFKRLDVDGNGTIDFDEFKAGAKREPLLVEAFLAPVRQGSLETAPAARRLSSASSSRSGRCDGREGLRSRLSSSAAHAAPGAGAEDVACGVPQVDDGLGKRFRVGSDGAAPSHGGDV